MNKSENSLVENGKFYKTWHTRKDKNKRKYKY